jgi:hypothetical protein
MLDFPSTRLSSRLTEARPLRLPFLLPRDSNFLLREARELILELPTRQEISVELLSSMSRIWQRFLLPDAWDLLED